MDRERKNKFLSYSSFEKKKKIQHTKGISESVNISRRDYTMVSPFKKKKENVRGVILYRFAISANSKIGQET